MANAEKEIEIKLMVRSLSALSERLIAAGAELVSPRVHETNLRFDTPNGELSAERKALRLRQDAVSRLTFKGPQQPGEMASIRQEIEFEVSDFDAAQRFLKALGYVVMVIYEKYRTTYRLGQVEVTLDELPFGNFAEIEGKVAGTNTGVVALLQSTASSLGLDWKARSSLSYLALFDLLRQRRNLAAHDLTFADLQGVTVQPEDFGLRYAD